jgi:hypothetical protein
MISAWAPLLRPGSRPCPRFGGRFDRVGAVFAHESRNSRAASAPAQPKEVLFSISSRRPTFAPAFRSASAKPPVSVSVMWSRIAATSWSGVRASLP